MTPRGFLEATTSALRLLPLFFLLAVGTLFATLAPRFLSLDNLAAILTQSAWLATVTMGMHFVLLTAGVDLSVGAVMYVAAVVAALGLGGSPVWVSLLGAVLTGAVLGAANGFFIVRLRLPAFIATLATLFVARGIGLQLSGTKVVFASPELAAFGRAQVAGVPAPLLLAGAALLVGQLLLRATPVGVYARSIGADREGASRVGVPVAAITLSIYCLSGALAGLGGFISLSQTSAASGAFGQNAEFLAIAAAVLGGTSLFGGRGSFWGSIAGALLITTVQNGLVMIDANPYAYPVITGAIIFLAALLDSVRRRTVERLENRRLTVGAPARGHTIPGSQ